MSERSWLKDGCPKCGRKCLPSRQERERGWCSSCEVATWSEEKKRAFGRVLSLSLNGGSKVDKERAVKDVMKYCVTKHEDKGGSK
jgi:hypothetical protein